MKKQNPIDLTRKNNRTKTATKSLPKPARARDNRWNKNEEHSKDVFETYTYKDYEERNQDPFG